MKNKLFKVLIFLVSIQAFSGNYNPHKKLIKSLKKIGNYDFALSLATSEQDLDLIYEMLRNNASVHADVGVEGRTLLHIATLHKNIFLVELFLRHGALINQIDHQGRTSLHYAAMMGDREMVQYLIKHGADPDIKSKSDKCALDYAIEHKHLQVIQDLFERPW